MDPKENKRIARQMKKKEAEKPVEKITVENEIDILEHQVYADHLKVKMKGARDQFKVSPGKDSRWKRHPLMNLDELGLLDDAEKLTAEFVSITLKQSTLSSAVRAEVDKMCRSAFWEVRSQFELTSKN